MEGIDCLVERRVVGLRVSSHGEENQRAGLGRLSRSCQVMCSCIPAMEEKPKEGQ